MKLPVLHQDEPVICQIFITMEFHIYSHWKPNCFGYYFEFILKVDTSYSIPPFLQFSRQNIIH